MVGYHERAMSLSCPGRGFRWKPADGTGRAHKPTIRSTPEIRYGSNGVRNHTCFEVPLRELLSSPGEVPSNRRQELSARSCPARLAEVAVVTPRITHEVSSGPRSSRIRG